MNKQNTKYLLEKYPKIFAQYKLPMTQTAMCWGFECGDGWFALIDTLCDLIQRHCDEVQRKSKKFSFIDWATNYLKDLRYRRGLRGFWRNICSPFRYKKSDTDFQVEAEQVKEKYGGLRFYINYSDDYTENMIEFTENMSYHICEDCGTTRDAKPNETGWISTLCPKCRLEENRED